MNSQDFRNLSEAYLDVYENEQLDEMPYRVVTKNDGGEEVYVGGKYTTRKTARTKVNKEDERVGGYRHSIRKVDEENNELDEKVMGVDPEQRAALAAERKSGSKRLPPSSGKEYAANQKKSISYMNKLTKNNKIIPGMAHEEVEEFDEGIGSAIKSLFGKKKEPEAQKPLSRGAQLRAKYNTGPEKTETSVKRKILDKTRERAEKDEKEYGDSTYSKSVATKSREAHNKYLRAGYNKYGADRSDSGGMGGSGGSGSGNKARKRAAALNNSYDLFDYMMEYLIDEGYADTNENALVIMANMSEEWRENILTEVSQKEFDDGMRKAAAKMPSDVRTPSREELFGSEEEKSKIKLSNKVVNPTSNTSANIRKSSEYSSPRASRGLPAAGLN